MKIMLRAAIAAVGMASIGPAFAGEIESIEPYTAFQQLPGVIAMAPEENPSVATAQNGQATQVYATQSNRSSWFNDGGGSHEGANS